MDDEIDIKDLVIALWRKKIVIIVVTCIFLGLAILLYGRDNNKGKKTIASISDTKQKDINYVETDFILSRGTNKELDGVKATYKLTIDAGVIANLNTFATSTKFLEGTLSNMNLNSKKEIDDIKDNIVIIGNGTSDIITLLVSDEDETFATEISNEILIELKDKINKLYEIEEVIIIDGPKEIEKDELEEKIKNSNIIIDEGKESTLQNTSAQNPKKKLILFACIGFVLSSGVIVVLELFSNSVSSQKQLENATNLKTFIKIPKTESDVSDIFKLLRVNVNDSKAILVTSPERKDGKSFVSMNLAKSFAKFGKKTLLVSTEYLVNNKIEKNINESNIKNLSILSLKENSNTSVEFSDSKIIENLNELEELFDVVVIDSSNVLESANTLTIAKNVKSTILVISERKTKLENIIRAKNSIEDIGGKVIGNVLNKSTEK